MDLQTGFPTFGDQRRYGAGQRDIGGKGRGSLGQAQVGNQITQQRVQRAIGIDLHGGFAVQHQHAAVTLLHADIQTTLRIA